MRVLVTGASGFIGLSVISHLTKINCQVLAISRKTVNATGTNTRWLSADLSNPSTYKDSITSFSPEVVIHLAWQDIPDFSFENSCQNLNQSLELLKIV